MGGPTHYLPLAKAAEACGWDTAVETILGSSLQAIAVESIENIAEAIAGLGNANMSFVELRATQDNAINSRVNLPKIITKVQGDSVPAMLSNVYAADTLLAAMQAKHALGASESIVTREGIWLGLDWLRVYESADAGQGVIARQQQLSELETTMSATEAKLSACQADQERGEAAVLEAEQEKIHAAKIRELREKVVAEEKYIKEIYFSKKVSMWL